MVKIKHFLCILSLAVLAQTAVCQNNTNSPYTRYGFGNITDNNNGEQRGMGGVSLASRANTSINFSNPASYSAVDSMTFMFDVAVSGLNSFFRSGNQQSNTFTANLEYITLQIPLWKNMGLSAGVIPYSFAGYKYFTQQILPPESYPDTITYKNSFSGQGGISQVYGGLSYNFFKHISLGVNAYYMFGSAVNARTLTFSNNATDFYPSYQSDSLTVSNLRLRYGLQFFHTFGKVHDFTLGFVYETQSKLNAIYSEQTGSVKSEATPYEEKFAKFETPQTFGGGLNYRYNNQLTVGADYTLQQWAAVNFMGKTDTLANSSRLAVGANWIPNLRGRTYFEHINYRLGFNVSDPYYKIDGQQLPKNFGVTFGLGLPLKSFNTVVNASFEYGQIGSASKLREDYFKITINAVFKENWFFKRKL
ncbi:MAG: hypothetical protein LBN23_03345 [Paludibacter sp.]|jgi:hypothetical protein|nr:hypothetical protein [Paludibacter sp.]